MSNPRMKFDKDMKSFLKSLDKNRSIDYNNPTIKRCVYECDKREYITGIRNCGSTDSNIIVFDITNPKLTKAGYDYLYPKKDWIGILTLLTSLLTAIGVLLQLVLSIGG